MGEDKEQDKDKDMDAEATVQLPVPVDDDEEEDERKHSAVENTKEEEAASNPGRDLFRPLFRDDLKAEGKQKIIEKHLTEKRKLASDVSTRMEKQVKNIDEIKARIGEYET